MGTTGHASESAMSAQVTESEKEHTTLREVFGKCWRRLKVWAAWLCDPEGPSLRKYIIDIGLRFSGLLIGASGILALLDTFTLNYVEFIQINGMRYLGGGLLLFGSTLYFLGKHAKRIEFKTATYSEDIDALVCDVEQNLQNLENENKKEVALSEIDRLKRFKNKPSEVSIKKLACLQNIRIDALDKEELAADARSSLSEYKFLVGNNEDYVRYETIINDRISFDKIDDLRSYLKELHQEIYEEKFSIGYGEAVLESLSHWSIPAIIPLFVIGVNPLLSAPYFQGELTLLHWGVLGMTGAILYSVNQMRDKDTTKVGEDEGNLVLRTMLLGIMLGAISAILLYVSVKSGILGGKVLPNLTAEIVSDRDQVVINALSLFWGIAAGYSAKLADRLVGSSSGATTP